MKERLYGYLYGVYFHGREFVIWYDSRAEAIHEAMHVEDKHAPAEMIRVPLGNHVGRSEMFFYGERINGAERRWHTRSEALADGAIDEQG